MLVVLRTLSPRDVYQLLNRDGSFGSRILLSRNMHGLVDLRGSLLDKG